MERPEKGTVEDLVQYRIATAKSDLQAALLLLGEKEYRAANNRGLTMQFFMQYQRFMPWTEKHINVIKMH